LTADRPSPGRSRFLAIALVSAAVLLLQIATTRILSVVLWYHWAFFSISLAMLGVGAPGVWFTFGRRRAELLPRLLLGASGLVVAGVVGIIKASKYFGSSAILFCLVCLLPAVLCMGGAVCILLLEAKGQHIGRMYAFDLLGACTGALIVIPLMWVVPTPSLAGGIGLLPLAAYLAIGGSKRVAAATAAVIVAMLAWGEPFALRHVKVYEETGPQLTPIYERWTPTARLTIFDSIFFMDASAGFGWGMGKRPPPVRPPTQYWLEQDGSAGTPITQFTGDTNQLLYLLHDVTTIAYQLRPPRTVAIVGAGGGRDILTALLAKAERIDAIELNAGIVEALRGPFAEFSGRVYDRPGVHAIVGEGRSVLTASAGGYDLIQISLIDSWAATAAGAYSLSENNLYTLEAYRLYWSKLSERGMISTSRWMLGGFGLEMPRLLLLVRAALAAEGVSAPERHVAMLQGGAVGTLLVSRVPFDQPDVERLRSIAFQRGFTMHLPEPDPPETVWMRHVWERGPDLFRPHGLIMRPPTDDRPFFFQVLSPLRPIPRHLARTAGINAEGVTALQRLMLVMVGVTLLLFFAPFPLRQWVRPAPGFWRGSVFFTCIGLSFMFVEIAWLQRFILYLGHPSLATTVALGCILFGAGMGSTLSERLGVAGGARLGFLLPLLVLVLNGTLAPLFASTLGWTWGARLLLACVVLVPTGFMMGFFFPLGMVRFGDQNRAWFWALNGAAGVLASVVSLAFSMEIGFSNVAYVGAGIYVVAWLLLRGGAPQGASDPSPAQGSSSAPNGDNASDRKADQNRTDGKATDEKLDEGRADRESADEKTDNRPTDG